MVEKARGERADLVRGEIQLGEARNMVEGACREHADLVRGEIQLGEARNIVEEARGERADLVEREIQMCEAEKSSGPLRNSDEPRPGQSPVTERDGKSLQAWARPCNPALGVTLPNTATMCATSWPKTASHPIPNAPFVRFVTVMLRLPLEEKLA